MKTIKPNKKIQKEIKKDLIAYGIVDKKGYEGWKKNHQEDIYKSIIKNLTISYVIAMIWAITLSIITTIIILHNYGTQLIQRTI